MKAVVAAFNQEKALVGAFSVITNLRMELFEALVSIYLSAQMPGMSGWMRNASVFHFAWLFKPDHCHTRHPMAPACTLWQQYRQTLDW